jgi:nucleoside-diphosphate-sugar epimerase
MILVTSGAGFIGPNLVAALNRLGHTNVVVNDFHGCERK